MRTHSQGEQSVAATLWVQRPKWSTTAAYLHQWVEAGTQRGNAWLAQSLGTLCLLVIIAIGVNAGRCWWWGGVGGVCVGGVYMIVQAISYNGMWLGNNSPCKPQYMLT